MKSTHYEVVLSYCQRFLRNNDAEYTNHQVAMLLNQLHTEPIKSCSRQSNDDNALFESKIPQLLVKPLVITI